MCLLKRCRRRDKVGNLLSLRLHTLHIFFLSLLRGYGYILWRHSHPEDQLLVCFRTSWCIFVDVETMLSSNVVYSLLTSSSSSSSSAVAGRRCPVGRPIFYGAGRGCSSHAEPSNYRRRASDLAVRVPDIFTPNVSFRPFPPDYPPIRPCRIVRTATPPRCVHQPVRTAAWRQTTKKPDLLAKCLNLRWKWPPRCQLLVAKCLNELASHSRKRIIYPSFFFLRLRNNFLASRWFITLSRLQSHAPDVLRLFAPFLFIVLQSIHFVFQV